MRNENLKPGETPCLRCNNTGFQIFKAPNGTTYSGICKHVPQPKLPMEMKQEKPERKETVSA